MMTPSTRVKQSTARFLNVPRSVRDDCCFAYADNIKCAETDPVLFLAGMLELQRSSGTITSSRPETVETGRKDPE